MILHVNTFYITEKNRLSNTILQLNNLSKSYKEIKAVDDLSLEVKGKMIFGLLGPNGSGKTTTLGMLLGVIRQDKGSFSWFNNGSKDINRKKIGSLLETPNFYPYLTAYQNLEVTAKIKGLQLTSDLINEVLKKVDLFKRKDSKFKTFSLGMKQRLAIASALLGNPEVLVLDEPTNGLDPQGIAEIRDLIIQIGNEGKTILIASHILDEIEKICTHCAILKEGKLIRSGAIDDIIGNNDTLLITIGADDINQLKEMVEADPMISIYKDFDDRIIVSVDNSKDSAFLNQYFFDKGVVLNKLDVFSESLENQFLEIINKS